MSIISNKEIDEAAKRNSNNLKECEAFKNGAFSEEAKNYWFNIFKERSLSHILHKNPIRDFSFDREVNRGIIISCVASEKEELSILALSLQETEISRCHAIVVGINKEISRGVDLSLSLLKDNSNFKGFSDKGLLAEPLIFKKRDTGITDSSLFFTKHENKPWDRRFMYKKNKKRK